MGDVKNVEGETREPHLDTRSILQCRVHIFLCTGFRVTKEIIAAVLGASALSSVAEVDYESQFSR